MSWRKGGGIRSNTSQAVKCTAGDRAIGRVWIVNIIRPNTNCSSIRSMKSKHFWISWCRYHRSQRSVTWILALLNHKIICVVSVKYLGTDWVRTFDTNDFAPSTVRICNSCNSCTSWDGKLAWRIGCAVSVDTADGHNDTAGRITCGRSFWVWYNITPEHSRSCRCSTISQSHRICYGGWCT